MNRYFLKRKRRHGRLRPFTLVETMVSSTLGLTAMAVLMSLFLFPLRITRDCLSWWLMDFQMRLVRERILRGLAPGNGLRSADWEDMKAQNGVSAKVEKLDFRIDIQDEPTADFSDDATYRIGFTPGQELYYQDKNKIPLVPATITTSSLEFTLDESARTVSGIITVSTNVGGKSYERKVVMRTYIRNN